MKLARLAPLVLVALVGCTPSATTAADVGGVIITEQEVSNVLGSCPPAAESGITESVALQEMVSMEVLRDSAQTMEIELDDEFLLGIITEDVSTGPIVSEYPVCAELLMSQVAVQVLLYMGSEEELTQAIGGADVVVNPRFGTWSSADLSISGTGSVSVAADEG